MEEEIWLPYVNNGRYEVSTLGRVRSLYSRWGLRDKPNILSIRRDGKGYNQYRLYTGEGVSHYSKVHKMVLDTFSPNPDPEKLTQINHIDEDKDNNRIDNLEWCDGFHNMEHTFAKHYEFRSPEGEMVKIFNLRRFCQENNLTDSNMAKVLNGKRNHHKGWRRV